MFCACFFFFFSQHVFSDVCKPKFSKLFHMTWLYSKKKRCYADFIKVPPNKNEGRKTPNFARCTIAPPTSRPILNNNTRAPLTRVCKAMNAYVVISCFRKPQGILHCKPFNTNFSTLVYFQMDHYNCQRLNSPSTLYIVP